MAKNDKLINGLKEVARRNRNENIRIASERDTTQIYAALAISLYKNLDMSEKEKADAINMIFVDSQKIWEDAISNKEDIVEKCFRETGIQLQNK